MTFLKKIKTVIEACCGKLDTMEAEIHKQQSQMSNMQRQIEELTESQSGTTILLEEILFAVSQSQEELKDNPTVILHKEDNDLIENLVQNRLPHDVN